MLEETEAGVLHSAWAQENGSVMGERIVHRALHLRAHTGSTADPGLGVILPY
jgi:hypothetical protein